MPISDSGDLNLLIATNLALGIAVIAIFASAIAVGIREAWRRRERNAESPAGSVVELVPERRVTPRAAARIAVKAGQ